VLISQSVIIAAAVTVLVLIYSIRNSYKELERLRLHYDWELLKISNQLNSVDSIYQDRLKELDLIKNDIEYKYHEVLRMTAESHSGHRSPNLFEREAESMSTWLPPSQDDLSIRENSSKKPMSDINIKY
jgi:hypothetical protein